ncbi:hypothetical protein HYC85_013727 [Camellia sinensis]|uniref:Uncharacterized protein n=1 Tax=Camellia sinensis TaxID=4442 RepID=A0A7J7H475_CAMSI|nr:hypothetical protein HYC85_013727 [Camellia sinensis]
MEDKSLKVTAEVYDDSSSSSSQGTYERGSVSGNMLIIRPTTAPTSQTNPRGLSVVQVLPAWPDVDHPIRERAIGYGRNLFSFFYCVLLDLLYLTNFVQSSKYVFFFLKF